MVIKNTSGADVLRERSCAVRSKFAEQQAMIRVIFIASLVNRACSLMCNRLIPLRLRLLLKRLSFGAFTRGGHNVAYLSVRISEKRMRFRIVWL